MFFVIDTSQHFPQVLYIADTAQDTLNQLNGSKQFVNRTLHAIEHGKTRQLFLRPYWFEVVYKTPTDQGSVMFQSKEFFDCTEYARKDAEHAFDHVSGGPNGEPHTFFLTAWNKEDRKYYYTVRVREYVLGSH